MGMIQVQLIADRVAQNLEILLKNFQLRTRRTRILMGLIITTMLFDGTNRNAHAQKNFWFVDKVLERISRMSASTRLLRCDTNNFRCDITHLYVTCHELTEICHYTGRGLSIIHPTTHPPNQPHTHPHTHLHVHTHTHIHVHTHTYTHTRTHTHTHKPRRPRTHVYTHDTHT